MTEEQATHAALATGRTFVWHELYVADTASATEFYEKALGLGKMSMDMGEMGSYDMMTNNGVPVCGVLSTTAPQFQGIPPHWATYLAVDDVDSRLEKVTANGGKIVVPALDVPTIGRMALIQDPQGATIWIFKPQM
jgi:uncharacterized protein